MKKKWIWLLLPAALLLLVLLHVHSLARLAPSEMGRQVPVLMYHAVGDDCWGEEHLFVRPAELEQQLQYLSENGYETIFFEDLAHLERYEKPVILTFDDGYDDNYTLLLPLLQKYHMKATIFMIAGDIGGPHKLTQPQLRELTQSGLVSIQSHGWSHKNMAAMGWPALVCELLRSKLALTLACGRVPTAVSYPNGKCTERTRTAAGWFYAYGVRTFDGTYLTGTDPLLIPRTAIPRGMTPEQFEYMKLEMQAGRNLTRADNLGKKRVCVVADTMAKNYFGDKDPIGETVSVTMDDGSIYDFVVVGVYKYNAALFGKVDTSVREKDRSTYMMIPIQTSFKLQGADKTGYEYFNLLLTPLADVNQATEDIQNYFDEVYQNNTNFHVTASNMQSSMGMINTVLNVITIAVSGIAAISLIVGGVGVMNIMLVSITERTREIGVRMALGAKRRTIRMQFVIEAIMLCLIGGIIGILIGVGVGALLGQAAKFVIANMYSEYSNYIIMQVHPSATAILLSLFFSMLTGVFFGYYPANKASKMEVIDALRYE